MKVIHPIVRQLLVPALLLLQLIAAINAAQAQELPVAFNGKIAGDDATTRFFLDFDKNLRLKTFYMDEPYRIIIDLEEARFNFGEAGEPRPRGLISAVQYGRISKGRSRIVLTLSQPAEVIRASMQQKLDDKHFRFLLDMDSTEPQTFTGLLDTQEKELGESGAVAIKGDRVRPVIKEQGRFTIVLDPGHGGIDGGAVGSGGAREKEIVLQVAKKIRAEVEALGPYDVVMTRDDDMFISLRERLDFSRRTKADLFVSLHADSLRQKFVRGASIYTLSKNASDKLSERLAKAENSVDLVAGLAAESDVEAVTGILVDLTTKETKKFSKAFSRILVKNLNGEIQLIKNPLRSAAFGVLKAPDVPGILMELGYLSNLEDEKLLQDPAWQQRLASVVAKSIDGFFSLRKDR